MKKSVKKLFSVLLAGLLLFTAVPSAGLTAAAVGTGSCGESLTWSFDADTGTLSVSGTGSMDNYTNQAPPWSAFAAAIVTVVINDGVAALGTNCMRGLPALAAVYVYNGAGFAGAGIPPTATIFGYYGSTAQFYAAANGILYCPAPAGEALGHVFNETFTVTLAPTCTEPGEKVRRCVRCPAQTENTVLMPVGHSFGDWQLRTASTCIQEGTQVRVCACLREETRPLALAGHTPGEWVNYDDPTCAEDFVQHKYCSVCYTLLETRFAEPDTHTSSEWIPIADATCTHGGVESRICPDCGLVHETRATSPLGHSPSNWIPDVPAACAVNGSCHIECTGCKEVLETRTLPAVGHSFSAWTTASEATCSAPGQRTRVCGVCGETEREATQQSAHTDANGDCLCDICAKTMPNFNFISYLFAFLEDLFRQLRLFLGK